MFKIGDVYLVTIATDTYMEEILDVTPTRVKLKKWGWVERKYIESKNPERIGYMKTKGFWPFKRKVLVRV